MPNLHKFIQSNYFYYLIIHQKSFVLIDKSLPQTKKIVVFASGKGSNAKKIIQHFDGHAEVEVSHVFSNKKTAPVLKMAHEHGVQAVHFDKAALYESNELLQMLQQIKPDLIVLAGFLWLMPKAIIEAFPNKIINVHPALLPKYGGKGMYGSFVHRAVLQNNDTETGITFHYVNENYDEGEHIAQFKVPIKPDETLDSLQEKIHGLEHEHFVQVIENLLQ